MYSHRRNQTHRQIPREIEAGVPENRSQKKQSAPQKPTDPWVFGYGKPPWETAAETLWETDVWYLLCPRMHTKHCKEETRLPERHVLPLSELPGLCSFGPRD